MEKWTTYKPLLVVLSFCFLLSFAQNHPFSGRSEFFMPFFMGYFFIFLSLFKFFDLNGFVEGFSMYDIVARRHRVYGYLYPFIEFFLGIAYLTKTGLLLTNIITVGVMLVSGFGVVKSLFSGEKMKCACLGSIINVPLSTVSILENFGMGAMAAYMLIF